MTRASFAMKIVSNALLCPQSVHPATSELISIRIPAGVHVPMKPTPTTPLKLVSRATITATNVHCPPQIVASVTPQVHTFPICKMETHAPSIVAIVFTLKTMEAQDPIRVNLVMLSVLHVQSRALTVPAVQLVFIVWEMCVIQHVPFLSILQIMPHGLVSQVVV